MAEKAKRAADALAAKKSECVKVVVRVRPLSSTELKDGRVAVTIAQSKAGEIHIKNPRADDREPAKVFTYDSTYGPTATQREIYDRTAAPIVENVMEGYNGTIFAYGQTGAGKTHTMEGRPDPPENRGIIPNSFKHIFDQIALNDNPSKQFLVRASYLEIYNEEIRDLLAKNPTNRLELKESVDSGVFVKDLTSFVVKSSAEIDTLMQAGNKNRSVGATKMNQTSSRSHSIFTITVETSEVREDGEAHIRVGKLNMVDLAGSERQSKTGATGQRFKEATKINLSLSALGNVISALVDSHSQHVPYRDSKLTRLLQDSLGGNTKTVMIANCGPADYNYDETVSTLRYASRAKQIKNKPKINEDPKDAMLREFQEEIERLRQELAAREGAGGGVAGAAAGPGGVAETKEPEVRIEKVVEKEVVEKVVEVEKLVGVSEEKVKEMQEQAEKEKEKLQQKLEAMQEKLLVGGTMLDKAAKQEEELRRAKIELEERQRQELALAHELEEANMMIEEQYASMQEEVEIKTKKLKKVYQRWQQAKSEVRDIQAEFQAEREDMLDTIRELQRQLKLKQLVIDNFIPPEEVERVEARARWDEETAVWQLPRLELAGNSIRAPRPVADPSARRPETEYAKRRGAYEGTARYRADNVAQLELDMPTRTTEDYGGPDMGRRVAAAMSAALAGEGDDDLMVAAPENLPAPYLSYEEGDDGPPSSSRRKERKRPGTASRKKKDSSRSSGGGGGGGDAAYPTARGLVSRD